MRLSLIVDTGLKRHTDRGSISLRLPCLYDIVAYGYCLAEQDQLPCEPLLATVKRQKLAWFGHVTRQDNLTKTIFHDILEGWRRRGRQRKCWMDNTKEQTSLPIPEMLTTASCRKKTGRGSVLNRPSCSPTTKSVKGLS